MSERSGIEIDYCPQCRGVWLDRGELDKLIDRSIGMAPPPAAAAPAPEYQQRGYSRPYDERTYKKKRKESLLSQLFD